MCGSQTDTQLVSQRSLSDRGISTNDPQCPEPGFLPKAIRSSAHGVLSGEQLPHGPTPEGDRAPRRFEAPQFDVIRSILN